VPTLEEMFEQAVATYRGRVSPPLAQLRETQERIEALHQQATSGDDAETREAAMRHYIQLVGDMQQQDA
jgi:hypothetical protein